MSTTYDEAKKFAEANIAPYSKEIDETAQFPIEIFKKIGEAGYFKLLIPAKFGGLGGNLRDHVDVCMAFAEGNPSVALCYMMHNVAATCLLAYGSPELKAQIINDIVENEQFMALAYSEFGTGTHFYKSEIKVSIDGDTYTFNGVKSMVTSAEAAKYYMVVAPDNQGNIDNWIFPLDTPGISFEQRAWHGIGMRGNVSCPMKLDNVSLNTFYRLGEAGSGMEQALTSVSPPFVLGLAAIYTGLSLQLLKITTGYAQKRVYLDGQALSHIETVQIHLSNIYASSQASKAFTLETAEAAVAGAPDALARILASRILASETAIESGRLAMRVGGGKAYNQTTLIETLLRDSYAGQIMAPSVDVLHVWLGKVLTDQPIP
ncbi:MAG: acyl-CoA/acyl-ACP dehydrogenase [Coriobacteriales bacterium]|jgi:alkylation response protein AidB-like acyl-CoA dehydrogenase|nr:acyl-CoA/acyl-ACP dehydrogenase [Coriobacteriales bacterium]